MQRKIMTGYLVMILFCAFIIGIFSYHVAQKHYISEVENRLLSIGSIIKQKVISLEDIYDHNNLNQIALDYGDITDIRITFIDAKGNVLGDSMADYMTLKNHSDRPEIIQAFREGQGESTRYSDSIKRYLKYIAIKIRHNQVPIVVRLSIPIDDIHVIRNELISFIAAGVLVAILAAGVLGVQFANKITRPINQLTTFSKDIAKGNFKGTVEIEANNEIGALAQSFMDMKTQLDKTITELWEKNVEMKAILDSMIGGLIAVDNDNRIIRISNTAIEMFGIKKKKIIGENILLVIRSHRFNQFLRENRDSFPLGNQQVLDIQYENKFYKIYLSRIEGKSPANKKIGTLIIIQDVTNIRKLEQMRSEFVSNVSHELKTPLTSIKGFIDTLKGGAIHDKEVAERFLDIIDIEAERLSNLIGDILELSEIETMSQDEHMDDYNLESIITEVFDIIHHSAVKKNIHIHYEIDEALSRVYVNKDKLKQMLINLIDNGIKYNNAGGAVKILCRRRHDIVEFHVRDDGIGIAPEHISRLFERFYRVDKGRSRNQGGTGLGLSIVKHIVNLYDGQIQVKSEVGKGTEFIIRLPIAI
ncbi:MAG: ATP-binding protein [Firmicutes bacterium]|nr:ATP-binding protein [Bacillota bacterium]